jgi:hypothetical protein
LERDGEAYSLQHQVVTPIALRFACRLKGEARRSCDRVELYLTDPHAPEFQDQALKRLIQETFGVSAEHFRTFILKGRLLRTRREVS